MNKQDKLRRHEIAHALLISARDLTKTAINKVEETGPSGISSALAVEHLETAIHLVASFINDIENGRIR